MQQKTVNRPAARLSAPSRPALRFPARNSPVGARREILGAFPIIERGTSGRTVRPCATTENIQGLRWRAARYADEGPPRPDEDPAPDRRRRRRAEIQFLTGAILHRGSGLGTVAMDELPGLRTSCSKIRSVAISRSWSALSSWLRIGPLMQIPPTVSDARPRDSAIRRRLPRASPRLDFLAAARTAPGTFEGPSRSLRSQRSTADRRMNSDKVVSSSCVTSVIRFTSQSGNMTLTALAKGHLLVGPGAPTGYGEPFWKRRAHSRDLKAPDHAS